VCPSNKKKRRPRLKTPPIPRVGGRAAQYWYVASRVCIQPSPLTTVMPVRMQVSMFAKGGVFFVVAYACIYARHASDGALLMHERCPVMCRSHPSHLSLACHQSSVRHDLALPLLYPTSRAATTCYSTRHMPCVAKIKQHAALYSRHLTPF